MTKRSYFICMVQRSGSNLLCEALTRSGVAGRPTESFIPAFPGSEKMHGHAGFEASPWARARGIETFDAFVREILRDGTTSNGVFGAKLPWNTFDDFLGKLRALAGSSDASELSLLSHLSPSPRFIHLRRRDRVKQAVSWALAAKTGRFASRDGAVALDGSEEPAFDVELVNNLYRLIGEGDAGWSAFYQRADVRPLELFYEDLADDPEGSVLRVLRFLDVEPPDAIDLSELEHQRQYAEINDRWAERFRGLRGSLGNS